MAYNDPKEGMGDCMACPHCGKPVYLSGDKGGGGAPPEQGEEWENDLRHTMSPRNGDEQEQEAM